MGFLGKNLRDELLENGYNNVTGFTSKDYDFRCSDHTYDFYSQQNPDVVFALASVVGGIQANRARPGDFFWENALIGGNLIDGAAKYTKVKKFVQVGTCCSYGDQCPIPFSENSLFTEWPNWSNRSYGVIKLALLQMLDSYKEQYGLRANYLIPVNMLGKYDSFDPNKSHFVPAIIKKVADAKRDEIDHISVWGNGNGSRELVDARDVSRALRLAMENLDDLTPINLGTGKEYLIKDTVAKICEVMEFDGYIKWDTSMPVGQLRRCVDISRAKALLNWEPQISLEESIRKSVEDYVKQ
jgi:GDP-L-fucose synthase